MQGFGCPSSLANGTVLFTELLDWTRSRSSYCVWAGGWLFDLSGLFSEAPQIIVEFSEGLDLLFEIGLVESYFDSLTQVTDCLLQRLVL